MTNYVKDILRVVRERKSVDMDWPQPFISSEEEAAPNIKRSEIRREVQRRLKEKSPDLP
ncbi:MAG: hypothetical protein WBF88_06905 [Pusillimonas sp.]